MNNNRTIEAKLGLAKGQDRWIDVQHGDVSAFTQVVDDFKNVVTAVAYSGTGDLDSSEDIAQETFLVAWQSRNELREPNRLAGWLCSIARNLCKQWNRQRTAKSWAHTNADQSQLSDRPLDPAEQLVTQEEQQLMWRSLEAIPESYRDVLILYYRQSQSIAEVALALDISEETARQRLSRGRGLLREEVERTIETTLKRTRASSSFTAEVMSLIASTGIGSALIKTTGAAAGGAIGKTIATQGVTLATKLVSSSAAASVAGGAVGALGGLFGAWLGIWVPQQLAATMTERKLLEAEGRYLWRGIVANLILVAISIPCYLISGLAAYGIVLTVVGGVGFALWCIVRGVRLNRQIVKIRQTVRPEDDPNPTWLKQQLGYEENSKRIVRFGRRATSSRSLLGLPLYDIQVSDVLLHQRSDSQLRAQGWLAVGDRASGVIAIGGAATGFLAIGGRAIGVIALGGFSLGLFSFGGFAVGLLALGGLAIGHQSAGGLAVGVHSAHGGFAVSGSIAEGGFAVSQKFAVGGKAIAPEANTEAAKRASAKSWLAPYIGQEAILKSLKSPTFIRNMVLISVGGVLLLVLVPLIFYKLMYRNPNRKNQSAA